MELHPLLEHPFDDHPNRYYGLAIGLVTNNKDPEKLGRCKVHFPWLHESGDESEWARLPYPMGGAGRGFWFIPEIDDEVICAFEHGDIRFPYILGSLYNGIDRPPSFGEAGDFNQDGKNDLRGIKSRSGHKLLFHDGGSKVECMDKKGNFWRLDTDSDSNQMEANKDVSVTAKGGDIKILAANNVIIKAGSNIKGNADADVALKAGANVTATAGAKLTMSSTGAMTVDAGATLTATSGSPMTISSKAAASVSSGANMSFDTGSTYGLTAGAAINVGAGGNLQASAGGAMSVGSKGTVSVGAGACLGLGSMGNASLGASGSCSINAAGIMNVGSGGAVTVSGGMVAKQ